MEMLCLTHDASEKDNRVMCCPGRSITNKLFDDRKFRMSGDAVATVQTR